MRTLTAHWVSRQTYKNAPGFFMLSLQLAGASVLKIKSMYGVWLLYKYEVRPYERIQFANDELTYSAYCRTIVT